MNNYDLGPLRDIPEIEAKSVCASITEQGHTIHTLHLRYPWMVHGDFLRHRVFSNSVGSNRAVPTATMLTRHTPYVPQFKHNQAGMVAGEYLDARDQAEAEKIWLDLAAYTRRACAKLADKNGLSIHKGWTNRPLQWFGFCEQLVTATDYANFDSLRDHPAAQDEIRILCRKMKEARAQASPRGLGVGEWHLPYISDQERETFEKQELFNSRVMTLFENTLLKDIPPWRQLLLVVSAARCCRVSYLKHDGTASALQEDIDRFFRLLPDNEPVHASPMEHQATPRNWWSRLRTGNFGPGFAQFRKFLPSEAFFG